MTTIKCKYIFLLLSFVSLNISYINAQDKQTDILVIDGVNLSDIEVLGKVPQKKTILIDDSELTLPILTTNNTITVHIGAANMYDTYLSPLEYKGTSVRLMYEQMRRTTWFDYKFYKQQIFDLEVAKGDNPAKNATEYWVLANYRIGGHYRIHSTTQFRIGVGGFWDANLGVLYNERNGNNPATVRAYTNLNLSLQASYKLKWVAVRWQIDTPVIGALFSPRYGQSYYEVSLGNTAEVINFASLHNQRALRNYLTIDIPVNKYTIRVGYMGEYYQTKVHNIQTHHYTNSFVIGFPIEGVKQPKRKAQNNYWNGN